MTECYVLTFTQDAKVLAAALRCKLPSVHVRGQKAALLLRILHCCLLAMGGVAVSYIVSDLMTGHATFAHWGSAVGIALVYLVVFGSIFITAPVMIRRGLATRANQGAVEMVIDASGVQTTARHFHSKIEWSGFEGMTRSRLGFVLWFGVNRPSIPFAAFDGPAQIANFEADVGNWLEGSR